VETTLHLALCRRIGHVTFAMVPMALGLGTKPQCESCRSGSACIARCLRGKAAISPWKLPRYRNGEHGPEPLLNKKRWIQIALPRCAPKYGPPNPSALPQSPIIPGPTTPPRVPVARSRAASDPVPEIHHKLHPSSIFRGRHMPDESQHQQKWSMYGIGGTPDRLRPERRRVVSRGPYQR
jgi:hypothetical protein